MVKRTQDELEQFRQALKEIRATAEFELKSPTGLHMICLSIIAKKANKVLGDEDEGLAKDHPAHRRETD